MNKACKYFLYDMAIVSLIIIGVCALGGISSADINAVFCAVIALACFAMTRGIFVLEKRLKHKPKAKPSVLVRNNAKATLVA